MKTITVNTIKSYDILIGRGLIETIGKCVSDITKSSVAAVVTDDIVDALYGDKVTASLNAAGLRTVKFVIKNGEMSKNADNFIALLNFLADEKLTRSDTVVALGGGVVGDLAGFAASTYMRGVSLIQIPTTLLSAVDSSVGGKTAIDLNAGKNLAGTFYQPDLVLCDIDLLDTLSDDIFRDGVAEVIKYGVLADSGLFDMLKEPIKPQLEAIIARCVTIKRDIVSEDEKEMGLRKLLNFGHTIGHAAEQCSNLALSHGKGVAIGMAVMARACAKKNLCSLETARAIQTLITNCGLPVTTDFSATILSNAALSDKKRSGNSITLVIPTAIGHCELHTIPTSELEGFIALGLEQEDDKR